MQEGASRERCEGDGHKKKKLWCWCWVCRVLHGRGEIEIEIEAWMGRGACGKRLWERHRGSVEGRGVKELDSPPTPCTTLGPRS